MVFDLPVDVIIGSKYLCSNLSSNEVSPEPTVLALKLN